MGRKMSQSRELQDCRTFTCFVNSRCIPSYIHTRVLAQVCEWFTRPTRVIVLRRNPQFFMNYTTSISGIGLYVNKSEWIQMPYCYPRCLLALRGVYSCSCSEQSFPGLARVRMLLTFAFKIPCFGESLDI